MPGRTFPPGLAEAIARALAKKPEERFASAVDFAAALKPFAAAQSKGLTAMMPAQPASGHGYAQQPAPPPMPMAVQRAPGQPLHAQAMPQQGMQAQPMPGLPLQAQPMHAPPAVQGQPMPAGALAAMPLPPVQPWPPAAGHAGHGPASGTSPASGQPFAPQSFQQPFAPPPSSAVKPAARTSVGLIFGVAGACLVIGVVLAVVVMRLFF